MKGDVLFLRPEFHEKMWGGEKLADFGFKLKSDQTGEAWLCTDRKGSQSTVMAGKYQGMTLENVREHAHGTFGGKKTPLPLLVKMIDAHETLSIQVHPDDEYAQKHGEPNGKTEAWYILSADEDSFIYYGHNAQTKNELREALANGEIEKLLNKEKVEAGDFYYIPAGTVHALGKGVVAYEVQQSSDTTYRLYDFDRISPITAKKRELQIEEAFEVINVPDKLPAIETAEMQVDDAVVTQLISVDAFNLLKYEVAGKAKIPKTKHYTINTVIDGDGRLTVNGHDYALSKGMTYMLASTVYNWEIVGDITILAASEK